jgi:predicted metal-dependent hydrolase
MKTQKILKALAAAKSAHQTAATVSDRSFAAAKSAHEEHRKAKLAYKAAKKAARAAKLAWHKAREVSKRDLSKSGKSSKLVTKLEKKLAASKPKAPAKGKPAAKSA